MWYEKNYWKTGFKSTLYDLLTPESYLDSMRQSLSLLPDKKEQDVWDAGCGSGLLLLFLSRVSKGKVNYFGTDLLSAGLEKVKLRAKSLGISDSVTCLQNDITEKAPFKEGSMDAVIAHFSTYTIRDDNKRRQALSNMFDVLKPGGMLIISNPSKDYNASKIIVESAALIHTREGLWNAMVKSFFIYPFTKWLGLNFIQKQLRSDKWKAYTEEELKEELQQSGFEIGATQTVYAGSAYLMCAVKPG
ncbi:MAG: class I SAM-dependent methyltransferase [Nitrospinota bacterium]